MKLLRIAGAISAFLVLATTDRSTSVRAQQQRPAAVELDPGGLEVLELRPNFYMIVGAGGNIAVQTGADGTVVVDAGTAAKTEAVIAAIKKRTDRPIRYVIDTSADVDHAGGNAA